MWNEAHDRQKYAQVANHNEMEHMCWSACMIVLDNVFVAELQSSDLKITNNNSADFIDINLCSLSKTININ